MRFILPISPIITGKPVVELEKGNWFPVSLYLDAARYQTKSENKPLVSLEVIVQSNTVTLGLGNALLTGRIDRIFWKLFPSFPNKADLMRCMEEMQEMQFDRTLIVELDLHKGIGCASLILERMPDWLQQILSPFAVA